MLWILCQALISGLLMGCIYALLSVGLTIIFGVMKMVNFAQGEFLMVGMYLTYMFSKVWAGNLYVLIAPVALLMFLLGLVVFKVSIRQIIGQGGTSFVVLTMGLAFFLECLMQIIFGADYLTVPSPIKNTYVPFIGGTSAHLPRLIAAGVMIVFVAGVYIFLQKTDFGRAMRSTSENIETAELLGVNTGLAFSVAFALGIMFAGITGLLLTPVYYVYPTVSAPFKTIAMVVVVLGGLGNIWGALLGGLIAGVLEALIASFVAPDLGPVGAFIVLIVVLIFKPDGIFGKGARKA